MRAERGPLARIFKTEEWEYILDRHFGIHDEIVRNYIANLRASGNHGLEFPALPKGVYAWRVLEEVNHLLEGSGFRLYQSKSGIRSKGPALHHIVRVKEKNGK